MLELADRLGAATLATGHYARVSTQPGASRLLLRVAADERKDQSYVLCRARARARSRGCASRSASCASRRSRELAQRAGLAVARKPDSQDLCFLAGTRHGDFLERHGGARQARRPDRRPRRRTSSASTPARTLTPSASAAASDSLRRKPLYVLATDARREHRHRRPAPGAARRASLRVRDVTLHRDGARVDGVRVRAHGRTLRLPAAQARARRRRATRGSRRAREPAERTARARSPACTPAIWSSGTAPSPRRAACRRWRSGSRAASPQYLSA